SALLLSQAILRAQEARPPRLWLVTRGAAPVSGGTPVSIAQAPLVGFGRTLQSEHADFAVKLIDLDPILRPGETEALLGEILRGDREDEIALRREGRFVARIVRGTAAPSSPATTFRTDGTYLITGGLGGLGISFAEWMVGRGARHLVLVGRSGPSADA